MKRGYQFIAALCGLTLCRPGPLSAIVDGQEASYSFGQLCPTSFGPYPKINDHCTNSQSMIGYDQALHHLFVTDPISNRVTVWDFSAGIPSSAFAVLGGQGMNGNVNPDPPNIEFNLYHPGQQLTYDPA